MKNRTSCTPLSCLGAFVGTALAGVIIYSNSFTTKADTTNLRRVAVPGTGTHCKRALSGGQMQVTIGKSTTECDYRTPIVSASGSDANFDITAKITLSPASALAKKTFLSVGLRESETGTGAGKYRLDVSPAAQRFALRRYDGVQKGAEATVFAQGKRNFIRAGKSNKIRLIVYNSAGQATLIARINGTVVSTATDRGPARRSPHAALDRPRDGVRPRRDWQLRQRGYSDSCALSASLANQSDLAPPTKVCQTGRTGLLYRLRISSRAAEISSENQ